MLKWTIQFINIQDGNRPSEGHILTDDSWDKYDVLTHYENALQNGWAVVSMAAESIEAYPITHFA